MKILLFTHESDIDGMGSIILSKIAFSEVTYELCETYTLQEKLNNYVVSQKIYAYDYVFITDIWLEEPMLTKIYNDQKLKNKIWLFDHHESAIKEGFNKYNFTKIVGKNNLGKTCGTSLFYEYLVKQKFLKPSKVIAKFVELTRRYDTWEWKNKYDDEEAHELSLLFDCLGVEDYLKIILSKLQSDSIFTFNEVEKMLIAKEKRQILNACQKFETQIIYRFWHGLKIGVVFINYAIRNDLAEYLRKIKKDIDIIMEISLENGTISFRSIKDGIEVISLAETLGGKGHKFVAGAPISLLTQEKIIDMLLKEQGNESLNY